MWNKIQNTKAHEDASKQIYSTGRFHININLNNEFKDNIKFFMENPLKNESMQKNDNRISLLVS